MALWALPFEVSFCSSSQRKKKVNARAKEVGEMRVKVKIKKNTYRAMIWTCDAEPLAAQSSGVCASSIKLRPTGAAYT